MNSDDSKQLLTCFKYRSGQAARDCLAEGTLYFAAPHQLNDALEAKYDHATPEDFNRVMLQTYIEISQHRGGPAYGFDQQGIAEMAKAHARENQRLQNFTEQIGIFSAARRPDHQAMWTYYANNASGVCFELRWSQDIANRHQLWVTDVEYRSTARIHNCAEDWRTVFLDLARAHPEASLEELQRLSLDVLALHKQGILSATRATTIKHTDWAHENEIRLLAPHGKKALPVLAGVLKRVHFIRTDGDKWAEIMQLLHTGYPSVEIMQWELQHGNATPREMEFRLIPGLVNLRKL